MTTSAFSWARFDQAPLVGIIRNVSADDVAQVLPVYRDAGLTTIEITLNTPGAEDMIRQAVEQYGTDLNIGAGTVCTAEELEKALAAGARFIVTPIIDEAVIRRCTERGVPIFPGAFTPSEVYKAWTLGASMVKVFPTTTLGPAYISDLKGPLPQIKLLPTGGVNLANLDQFFRAGASGVGVGSHLFDKTLIRDKQWSLLKTHFQTFLDKLPHTV